MILGENWVLDSISTDQWEFRMNRKCFVDFQSKVVMGEGSAFYAEASVVNLQNSRDKITIGYNSHIRSELLLYKHCGCIKIGSNSFIGAGSKI
ncbi:MAG: acetyltransferase-like isoleucine patch superfamily enzyme [Dokdonia sp.]|jgi:acetyltransferase-like isoleucine patch superfamily enzyme